MSKISGFLGGVVLTTSIYYLTSHEMQKNAKYNSEVLRESRRRAESLLLPPQTPKNPEPFVGRPSLVETLKDAWNLEIEGMAHWMQGVDMVKARESVEETVGNVIDKIQKS
ncbi:hypothetical protein RUND412_005432 [Rhizina undulata]